MSICGLDFGTSNSTVGVMRNGVPEMAQLEKNPATSALETTLPSALFFDFEDDSISFGRHAIENYTQGEFGRLMRSMKSILGSGQMDEGTQIKNRVYSFSEIIGFFVSRLKAQAEAHADESMTSVVMGRPVHFNDDNPELDNAAERRLEEIAHSVGFKDVSFQFEPIAAAYDYEQTVEDEELALIIDIGGGTSDFTLMKLSKAGKARSDRKSDLLANHGIHIGGTDFDRHLSLATVMPLLGLGLPYKDKPAISMPKHYYYDLATWHQIHNLYEPQVIRDIADLRLRMQSKAPIDRLLSVLKQKDGHRVAGRVEQAKIDLAGSPATEIELDFLAGTSDASDLQCCKADASTLHDAIENDVSRVFNAVDETLSQAGISAAEIDTIFTTGGSTALPSVKQLVKQQFGSANWVAGDLFNSVGKGLALEADRRYR